MDTPLPPTPDPLPLEEEPQGLGLKKYRLWILGLIICLLLFAGVRFLSPYYKAAHAYDLSHLNDLPVSTLLLDRNGAVLGRLNVSSRTILTGADIPPLVRHAFVAAEDRRFYTHRGLDIRGIVRAATINARKIRIVQGGSTITQQLAKHIIGDSRRTWDRKFREAFLAQRLESTFKKDEILTFYLNRVYFGSGYFGLAAAAEGYLGKKVGELTPGESALLAGLVRAPSSYSPRRNYERSFKRSQLVLEIMQELKFISQAERLKALTPWPTIQPAKPGGVFNHYRARILTETEQLLELSHREQMPQGLRIYTTLQNDLQNRVEELVQQETERAVRQSASGTPDQWEAAAVILDPASGDILAYVGGRDFDHRQFDHAAQARRQPSGLLYPWIAGLGIEKLGLSPASPLDAGYADENEAKLQGNAAALLVKSTDRHLLLLQDALIFGNFNALSRVAGALGGAPLAALLDQAGFPLPEGQASLSHAQWQPLTLLETTSLYGALGGTGQVFRPSIISKIETFSGEVLYESSPQVSAPLLSQETLGEIRHALIAKALEGGGRAATSNAAVGGQRALYASASPGELDSSCVGITPNVAVGVWMGSASGDTKFAFRTRQQGENATIPMWTHLVDAAMLISGKQGTFPAVPGLTEIEVDRRNGRIKGFSLMGGSEGSAVVLLNGQQMDALKKVSAESPETSQTPYGWSQWFSNIRAESGQPVEKAGSSKTVDREIIPEKLDLVLPPLRGAILSRDGQVFATTQKQQALVSTWPAPEKAASDEAVLAVIHSRIAIVEQELEVKVALTDVDIMERYRFRRFQPLELVGSLTQAQMQKFISANMEQHGLSLQGYPRRIYPQRFSLAHALGYLRKSQSVNVGKYLAGDAVYDDYVGASGLESLFDEQLRGQSGSLQINTREDGFLDKVAVTRAATPGANIRLTIQSRWQRAVELSLQGSLPAVGIVMDVTNGDILAMSSYPDFDPNDFVPRMSAETWKQLSESQYHPLLNRTYRQHYPPGSVFKIVTTIAAMRAGVFDPDRRIECTGSYRVGNVVYNIPREKGVVDFQKAMEQSFNTYFFDMALRTPLKELVKAGQDGGFGRKTGFLLPQEVPGCMPDQAYVRETHNRDMGPGDVTNTSIGQGDVLVTPLQLVRFMAAVANKGTFYQPRLVMQVEDGKGKVLKAMETEKQGEISLSSEQWDLLHKSLIGVTQHGTGHALQMDSMVVAAKTGTAEISQVPPRQIAWAAGFAPAEDPRFAFVFMVEGQEAMEISGGGTAVPMARKAIEAVLEPIAQ